MELYGIALLKNLPPNSLLEMLDSFGFPRQTHYGSRFIVQSKQNPTNVAYTSGTLGLHLDMPIYEVAPGVMTMICHSVDIVSA